MSKLFDDEIINSRIENRDKEFPLYPPQEGKVLLIEMLDDTFQIFSADEEDLLGEKGKDSGKKFDVVEIRVKDIMRDRERVFKSFAFNKVSTDILITAKGNGHNPRKMKGLQFRLTGLANYEVDVECLGMDKAKDEDAEELVEATTDDIKDAIKLSAQDSSLKGNKLVSAVKTLLKENNMSVVDEDIKRLIK